VKLNLGGSVHDPTDPIGRLLFNVLGMVAEWRIMGAVFVAVGPVAVEVLVGAGDELLVGVSAAHLGQPGGD